MKKMICMFSLLCAVLLIPAAPAKAAYAAAPADAYFYGIAPDAYYGDLPDSAAYDIPVWADDLSEDAFDLSLARVIDKADLIPDEEEEALAARILAHTESFASDFVFLSVNTTGGKGTEAYADDFYDMNGYGCGEDLTGVLLIVNMEERFVYVSTAGKEVQRIQPYVDDLLDAIWDDVTAGEFDRAVYSFLDHLEEIESGKLEPYDPYDPFDDPDYDPYYDPYHDPYYDPQYGPSGNRGLNMNPTVFLIGLAAAAAVAGLIVARMRSGMKPVNLASGARNYLIRSSFDLRHHNEIFIRRSVSRTPRAQNNNNNRSGGIGGGTHGGFSGGGFHVSSSGISHGGGGRHF